MRAFKNPFDPAVKLEAGCSCGNRSTQAAHDTDPLVGTLRWYETARRDCTGAGDPAQDAADGRAVLGARCAHPRRVLQEEVLKICAETRQTVFMITHDVDEAILLADKTFLMTNGPGAKIAEVVVVNLRH